MQKPKNPENIYLYHSPVIIIIIIIIIILLSLLLVYLIKSMITYM